MGLGDLLASAEAKITRLSPTEAWAAAGNGALLVDVRSDLARERTGVAPGSLHVPRTVLEWRFEPGGDWRNPHLAETGGMRVVLICDHGYSSVFAGASLVDLGYEDVADVIGGFEAWVAARLPVVPAPARGGYVLPGMGGPAR